MSWQEQVRMVVGAFRDANEMKRCTINVGNSDLTVLVATTPKQWAIGLTGVAREDDVDGMLFVMGDGTRTDFHLATVDYPILISFFGPKGTLIHADLMTRTNPRCHSPGPYSHVLELNANEDRPLDPGSPGKGVRRPRHQFGVSWNGQRWFLGGMAISFAVLSVCYFGISDERRWEPDIVGVLAAVAAVAIGWLAIHPTSVWAFRVGGTSGVGTLFARLISVFFGVVLLHQEDLVYATISELATTAMLLILWWVWWLVTIKTWHEAHKRIAGL